MDAHSVGRPEEKKELGKSFRLGKRGSLGSPLFTQWSYNVRSGRSLPKKGFVTLDSFQSDLDRFPAPGSKVPNCVQVFKYVS